MNDDKLRPRAPRVPVDAELTFWRDGNHGEGRLTDLSAGGFFTATDEPAPVGSRLEISFTLPHDRSGKIVTAEVIVVRRAEGGRPGFGARFFRLPKAAAGMIEEFLARSARRRT
ncbi:MAG TPA: PilZ domain-containing protein [Thermoanaerobaculia bacterium]|nr:PilZ domain-containing protein [Thermoanaerobaculia bacterium]